ncbi:hypothetical protein [Streptomyces ehimensis]|uniref:Uncharacterized protein n=1 Tax=Streptomyces ehimensis TaxID=68195 RepID=A0ABV9BDM4_9ACTN
MGMMVNFLNPYAADTEQREVAQFRGEPVRAIPGVIHARCGVEWDAVRVPPWLGERTLEALGRRIDPVLASGYASAWTFLIDCGWADQWDLGARGARLLRRDTVLELPLTATCDQTRDVRWVVPPGGWTDPDKLYRALGGEADPAPARRPAPTPRKRSSAKKSTA